jgi:hypothetical protein
VPQERERTVFQVFQGQKWSLDQKVSQKGEKFWPGEVLGEAILHQIPTPRYNGHKNTNRLSLMVKTNRRIQSESKSKFRGLSENFESSGRICTIG